MLAGKPAAADLEAEKKLHRLMRKVLSQPGVRAIHDVGEGGILWALAEMTFGETSAGADVILPAGGERPEEALFGEGGGRVILELNAEAVSGVEVLAKEAQVGFTRLGQTGGRELKVVCGSIQETWAVAELRNSFETSLPKALET